MVFLLKSPFVTDPTQKNLAIKQDSLVVPDTPYNFELQKGSAAYKYAVKIAKAAIREHAERGILLPGRMYGWLPLLFEVKSINHDRLERGFKRVLEEIESIPVVWGGRWC